MLHARTLALTTTLPQRLLLLLLVATFLGSLLVVAPPAPTTVNANPLLLQLAAEKPQQQVDIIVQKRSADAGLEAVVTRLGGRVRYALPIINGFAATLAAGAVPELAAHAGARWVSLDAPVIDQYTYLPTISPLKLKPAYPRAVNAHKLWNRSPKLRGQGVGVAIVDSGINPGQDFYSVAYNRDRIVAAVAVNEGYNPSVYDTFGHGNHVAGIVGASGTFSGYEYIGIAPEVNLINVKVSDDTNMGQSTTGTLLAGLQWIYDNHQTYNIRVVNISLTDSVIESYHVSAIDAAVELLWSQGIVVVVAAGNGGAGSLAAPANDPFVITVGAADDRGTPAITDDVMATWSSYGTTVDGFAKPDLVAPGVNIAAPLVDDNCWIAEQYPQLVFNGTNGVTYMKLSGTSMAAPVVAGAVALLLQDEPWLTPDQVKYRLMDTARSFGDGTADPASYGAGYVDASGAVDGWSDAYANLEVPISSLLVPDACLATTGDDDDDDGDGDDDGATSGCGTDASSGDPTAKWSTAKWSTAKWSTAKWSTANWSTMRLP